MIEVGDYKLYLGYWNDKKVVSIIHRGLLSDTVLKSYPAIPEDERNAFIAEMFENGKLCDSYMKRTTACTDFVYVMVRLDAMVV